MSHFIKQLLTPTTMQWGNFRVQETSQHCSSNCTEVKGAVTPHRNGGSKLQKASKYFIGNCIEILSVWAYGSCGEVKENCVVTLHVSSCMEYTGKSWRGDALRTKVNSSLQTMDVPWTSRRYSLSGYL